MGRPIAEIEEAARQAIEILAPGGELILGAGCALGYNTPSTISTPWWKPPGNTGYINQMERS